MEWVHAFEHAKRQNSAKYSLSKICFCFPCQRPWREKWLAKARKRKLLFCIIVTLNFKFNSIFFCVYGYWIEVPWVYWIRMTVKFSCNFTPEFCFCSKSIWLYRTRNVLFFMRSLFVFFRHTSCSDLYWALPPEAAQEACFLIKKMFWRNYMWKWLWVWKYFECRIIKRKLTTASLWY